MSTQIISLEPPFRGITKEMAAPHPSSPIQKSPIFSSTIMRKGVLGSDVGAVGCGNGEEKKYRRPTGMVGRVFGGVGKTLVYAIGMVATPQIEEVVDERYTVPRFLDDDTYDSVLFKILIFSTIVFITVMFDHLTDFIAYETMAWVFGRVVREDDGKVRKFVGRKGVAGRATEGKGEEEEPAGKSGSGEGDGGLRGVLRRIWRGLLVGGLMGILIIIIQLDLQLGYAWAVGKKTGEFGIGFGGDAFAGRVGLSGIGARLYSMGVYFYGGGFVIILYHYVYTMITVAFPTLFVQEFFVYEDGEEGKPADITVELVLDEEEEEGVGKEEEIRVDRGVAGGDEKESGRAPHLSGSVAEGKAEVVKPVQVEEKIKDAPLDNGKVDAPFEKEKPKGCNWVVSSFVDQRKAVKPRSDQWEQRQISRKWGIAEAEKKKKAARAQELREQQERREGDDRQRRIAEDRRKVVLAWRRQQLAEREFRRRAEKERQARIKLDLKWAELQKGPEDQWPAFWAKEVRSPREKNREEELEREREEERRREKEVWKNGMAKKGFDPDNFVYQPMEGVEITPPPPAFERVVPPLTPPPTTPSQQDRGSPRLIVVPPTPDTPTPAPRIQAQEAAHTLPAPAPPLAPAGPALLRVKSKDELPPQLRAVFEDATAPLPVWPAGQALPALPPQPADAGHLNIPWDHLQPAPYGLGDRVVGAFGLFYPPSPIVPALSDEDRLRLGPVFLPTPDAGGPTFLPGQNVEEVMGRVTAIVREETNRRAAVAAAAVVAAEVEMGLGRPQEVDVEEAVAVGLDVMEEGMPPGVGRVQNGLVPELLLPAPALPQAVEIVPQPQPQQPGPVPATIFPPVPVIPQPPVGYEMPGLVPAPAQPVTGTAPATARALPTSMQSKGPVIKIKNGQFVAPAGPAVLPPPPAVPAAPIAFDPINYENRAFIYGELASKPTIRLPSSRNKNYGKMLEMRQEQERQLAYRKLVDEAAAAEEEDEGEEDDWLTDGSVDGDIMDALGESTTGGAVRHPERKIAGRGGSKH